MLLRLTRKILIICSFLLTLGVVSAMAQSLTPSQALDRLYQSYDSAHYLTFDVKYIYTTDTVNNDFSNEVILGSYTMAGKRAKFNIGNIDFMQNDSFFISIYNQDKFILVSDPQTNNLGSQLPLRSQIDNLFASYGSHYTITNTSDSVTGLIQFIKQDSAAQFDKFSISYDNEMKYINSISYIFHENQYLDSASSDTSNVDPPIQNIFLRKKSLTIEFTNYRVNNVNESIYNQNNYIWFENGECKPVDKYLGYKVYYSRTGIIEKQPIAQ